MHFIEETKTRNISITNKIYKLISDGRNVQNVQDAKEYKLVEAIGDLKRLNSEVTMLLSYDEWKFDQDNWFDVKMATIGGFVQETNRWIAAVRESTATLPMDDGH